MSAENQTEVAEVEEPGTPEPAVSSLTVLLEKMDGPSPATIENWKATHGEVFVSAFSDTEAYLWRALRRGEFKELQRQLSDPELKMDQLQYEEEICRLCTLWPSVNADYFANAKGGTPSSLAEQIMQNSNFLTPQSPAFIAKL